MQKINVRRIVPWAVVLGEIRRLMMIVIVIVQSIQGAATTGSSDVWAVYETNKLQSVPQMIMRVETDPAYWGQPRGRGEHGHGAGVRGCCQTETNHSRSVVIVSNDDSAPVSSTNH